MASIFSFGERVPEYEMKVLNEREIRASAGILFLFAMISFLNSWLIGDFTITKAFVVVFMVDFMIRVLINPKYAPTLIIGRIFVRHQTVEYVGARQKRFAWAIGLVLSVVMFYLIVLNDMIGPFNLLVCLVCLTLLFFEAAFGICLGCKIYNLFHKEKAQLCPGNTCEINQREDIQKINFVQMAVLVLFVALVYSVANSSVIKRQKGQSLTSSSDSQEAEQDDCVVPDWAIAMGHRDKWKLHNGCTNSVANEAEQDAAEQAASPILATEPVSTIEHQPEATTNAPMAVEEANGDCVVPDWAIKMGHKDQWKLHNGCTDQ